MSHLWTWLFFTFLVYGMLIPFGAAYVLCRAFMFKTINETQSQLLKNTFLRTLCTVALIMLPNHFEAVLSPFVCDPSPTGSRFTPVNILIVNENNFCLQSFNIDRITVKYAVFARVLTQLEASYGYEMETC